MVAVAFVVLAEPSVASAGVVFAIVEDTMAIQRLVETVLDKRYTFYLQEKD